ncbi:hypothetical protein BZA05DRAFT_259067 [Tricharina praecox]|uniref:uncharacterized protein n=1 Tax=Tricharina praecox TaxID=43433 RepID=UPI00221EE27D|nr:uncharacterized protein BZA05DRAFT_259067 [Tricharina praecox]KAI5854147.1 hypothetical protein BZA05DRAFT_259067 [Tricharina praecox]
MRSLLWVLCSFSYGLSFFLRMFRDFFFFQSGWMEGGNLYITKKMRFSTRKRKRKIVFSPLLLYDHRPSLNCESRASIEHP